MNLLSRHLTGLIDFQGRENRQPFWLWVLIVYATQMVVSMIISIPLMSSYFQNLQPLMGRDSTYLNEHPEIASQMMMQAMGPMMRGMIILSMIMALLVFTLLAAAVVRRLHDGDRSGWWASPVFAMQIVTPVLYATVFPDMFGSFGKIRPDMSPAEVNAAMAPMMQSMSLISLVGMVGFLLMIVLIIFLALPGTSGPNRFGDDPLATP